MPENALELRRAAPSDSEFVYRVKKATFREYVEQVWGWDEEEQRRLHEERFATQEFQIIRLAGADAGFISVTQHLDHLHLNQIFILPEHQGQGIGTECVRQVLEQADRLRLPVRLRVMKVNPRAQALYQRLGFRQFGDTDTHVLMEFA